MGLTFNLGRISPSVFTDASLNVGIGAAPSGSYKFEVTGTSKFSTDSLVSGLTIGKGGGSVSTNTAIGYNALTANSSGFWNVALGYNALSGGNISSANVAIGYGAFSGASFVGGQNIGMGISAGSSLTSGGNNTLIGYLAGYSLTTGSSNIFIGYNTLNTVTTGNFNTVIGGFPSFSSSPSLSNNVIIADGAGNTRFWWDGSTLRLPTVVSIGNTNSTYNLDVTGTGRFTSDLTLANPSANTKLFINRASSAYTDGIIYQTNGTYDFTVGQNPLATGTSDYSIYSYGASAVVFNIARSTGAATFSSSVSSIVNADTYFQLSRGSGDYAFQIFRSYSGGQDFIRAKLSDNTTWHNFMTFEEGFSSHAVSKIIMQDQGGTVGIGTSTPSKPLEIFKSGSSTSQFKIGDASTSKGYLGVFSNSLYITAGGTFDSGWTTDGTNGIANIVMETSNGGSAIAFGTAASNTSPSERMRITSGGDIQFKGASTGVNQQANITNDDTYLTFYPSNSGSVLKATRFMFNGAAAEAMRITSAGNVGIGTTTVNNILSIRQSNTSTATVLELTNTSTGNNTTKAAQLLFMLTDTVGTVKDSAFIQSIPSSGYPNVQSADLVFATRISDAYPTEKMRITNNGTIGIAGSADVNNAVLDKISIGHLSGSYGWIQTWNATSLYLNKAGNAVYAGTQRIDNNSDERIKENIVPIENALDVVLALNGRKFNMLDEDNILRYGFIAQEVKPHLADFVTESKRTFEKEDIKIENLLTLESSGAAWAALLVEAIKEQQKQIEELKAKIK